MLNKKCTFFRKFCESFAKLLSQHFQIFVWNSKNSLHESAQNLIGILQKIIKMSFDIFIYRAARLRKSWNEIMWLIKNIHNGVKKCFNCFRNILRSKDLKLFSNYQIFQVSKKKDDKMMFLCLWFDIKLRFQDVFCKILKKNCSLNILSLNFLNSSLQKFSTYILKNPQYYLCIFYTFPQKCVKNIQ